MMRPASNRPRGGFTLIEMLVVVAIIVILTTVALGLMNILIRGSSSKHTARVIQAELARARQLATSTRIVHWLVFHPDNTNPDPVQWRPFMVIVRDANRDGVLGYSTATRLAFGGDAIIGDVTEVPKGVIYDTTAGIPMLAIPWPGGGGAFGVAFNSDGSLAYAPGVTDRTMNGPASNANSDFKLRQNGTTSQMFFDFSRSTGKVLKSYYTAQ